MTMQFLDILKEYNITYIEGGTHRHVRSGYIGLDCPFCGTLGKYHMGYNVQHGFCACWHCGSHSPVKVLRALTGRAFAACKHLMQQVSVRHDFKKVVHSGTFKAPVGIGPLKSQHRRYLQNRGLDPQKMVNLWGVQGISIAARYSWSIWIPICQYGRQVSWTTRSIGKNPPRRYTHADPSQEMVPIKQLLFGEDYCRHSIIVCEGPFDVFRIGPGAVATMGTVYTREQMLKIAKYPERAICFDNEPAAQRMAQRLVSELTMFPGNTYNIVLSSGDPGEAIQEEIDLLRKVVEHGWHEEQAV